MIVRCPYCNRIVDANEFRELKDKAVNDEKVWESMRERAEAEDKPLPDNFLNDISELIASVTANLVKLNELQTRLLKRESENYRLLMRKDEISKRVENERKKERDAR